MVSFCIDDKKFVIDQNQYTERTVIEQEINDKTLMIFANVDEKDPFDILLDKNDRSINIVYDGNVEITPEKIIVYKGVAALIIW